MYLSNKWKLRQVALYVVMRLVAKSAVKSSFGEWMNQDYKKELRSVKQLRRMNQ
jgi:hypothetical protein